MILQRARAIVKQIYSEACYLESLPKEAGLYYRFDSVRPAELSSFEVQVRLFYGFADAPKSRQSLRIVDGLLARLINAPAFEDGRTYFESAQLVQEAGFFSLWEVRFKVKLLKE